MSSSESETVATDPSLPHEEFVQLFTRTQRRLYLFILSHVPRVEDAEEILQETNVIIWQKCGQFRAGTNFFAWGAQIARFEILKFRERRQRSRLQFSDEFTAAVAAEVESRDDAMELRRAALDLCLQKLRRSDRDLIRRRYRPGESGKELADELGRPANSVYQSLGRIRRSLLECIRRQLATENVT